VWDIPDRRWPCGELLWGRDP